MKRKNFLQVMVLSPFVIGLISSCKKGRKITGTITGASAAIGHQLRDKPAEKAVSETISKKVVIIGAGISGLSAARQLMKKGVNDFLVLELENYPGGNSSYASNDISAYPQGAHYIPIPNLYLTEYISFLQENGVITGFDDKGLPVYNEMFLCFDSQERLFINGNWQEGVIPKRGLQKEDQKEIERFFVLMNEYRLLKGSDGKYAFNIPVNDSSSDEALQRLDNITMQQWLSQHHFTSPYLSWYVNYCTRDDFATTVDKVSAWAAIHYYASRKGIASNAQSADVLTWPEGNGFLMNKLLQVCKQQVRLNALTTSIKQTNNGVEVSFLDTLTQKKVLVHAQQCILACPQYITGRLLHDKSRMDTVKQHFSYTPWLVANIKTTFPKHPAEIGLSWDNVFYNSPSLGYVNATHQLPQQTVGLTNITYYLPLTDSDAKTERVKASTLAHEDWCKMIMADMEKAHPGIGDLVAEINVTLWGHSMVQPLPGFVTGEERKELARSIGNNIHFAHTDIAGLSIFEEAFYQGIQAADKVIVNL